MKILLVNNYSIYFPHLKELLSKSNEVSVVNMEDLTLEMSKDFDAIVLSGGSKYEVSEDPEEFLEQIKIMKSGKPVFGVCLGFQAMCHAFGDKVIKLEKEIEGIEDIEIVKKDPILKGVPKKFQGYEGHSWGVKEIKGELIVLAKSKHCIELVKHPKLPIYGSQFHPEEHQELDATKILINFLNNHKLNKKL